MCKAFACAVSLQSAIGHGRAGSTLAGSSRTLPEAAGMGYTVGLAWLLKFGNIAHASLRSLTALLLGELLRNGNRLSPLGDPETQQNQFLWVLSGLLQRWHQ